MAGSSHGWEISLYHHHETVYADLKLATGLLLRQVKVYGVTEATPHQRLTVIKRDDEYCVVGGRLLGGGCCGSTAGQTSLEPQKMKPAKSFEVVQRQASNYADMIKKKCKLGAFSDLPLAELNDVPVSTVKNPWFIAEALIDVLKSNKIWLNAWNFQIRYTIARLARKFFFSFTIHSSISFDNELLLMKIKTEASIKKAKKNKVDSATLAELLVISSLIEKLESNRDWWEKLKDNGSPLMDSYYQKSPFPLLEPSVVLIDHFRSSLGKDDLVERALLIDQLYTLEAHHARNVLEEIVKEDLPWQVHVLALSYLEWSIHRGVIKKQQIVELKPVVIHLVNLNESHINEKLMSILLKLTLVQEGFRNLLGTVRMNIGEEVGGYFDGLKEEGIARLSPETKQVCLTNLITSKHAFAVEKRRSEELKKVKLALESYKSAFIAGLNGTGKTTLAKKVGEGYLREFNIVWFCTADNKKSLHEAMRALAKVLKVEARAKDQYGSMIDNFDGKVLIIFDNAHESLNKYFRRFTAAKVHTLFTTTDFRLNNKHILLEGWSVESAVAYLSDDPNAQLHEYSELVKRLSCIPTPLKVAKYFMKATQTSVKDVLNMLDGSVDYLCEQDDLAELRVSKIISSSIDKAIEQRHEVEVVLFLGAILSENIPVDFFRELAITLKPDIDYIQAMKIAISFALMERNEDHTKVGMQRVIQLIMKGRSPHVPDNFENLLQIILKRLSVEHHKLAVLRCTTSLVNFILWKKEVSLAGIHFCVEIMFEEFKHGESPKTELLMKLYTSLRHPINRIASVEPASLENLGKLLLRCGCSDQAFELFEISELNGGEIESEVLSLMPEENDDMDLSQG
mmetsp:Transcript_24196/g.43000  ORF Transcript_24196/g.43000 Transcript_24196/m.43000 type:complete len:852 (+) Transcript_24196:32-2587(+)